MGLKLCTPVTSLATPLSQFGNPANVLGQAGSWSLPAPSPSIFPGDLLSMEETEAQTDAQEALALTGGSSQKSQVTEGIETRKGQERWSEGGEPAEGQTARLSSVPRCSPDP